MAVADLAHALEVAVLGNEATAPVLHRLEDHRGDRVGALELDRLLDRIRRPQGIALLLPAVGVGVRHMHAPRRERFERRAQGRQPRRRERAHRGAVVGQHARDQLVPCPLAARSVVGLGELPRRLDGLRAAGGEEDAVQRCRRQPGDARGQLDRARVRVAPVGVEAELAGLPRRRVGDLGAAVADVDAVQGGESVQVALAVLVIHVAPLAAHDHRHLGVRVGAHAREVHPQVALGVALQPALGAVGEPRTPRSRRVPGSCRAGHGRAGLIGVIGRGGHGSSLLRTFSSRALRLDTRDNGTAR